MKTRAELKEQLLAELHKLDRQSFAELTHNVPEMFGGDHAFVLTPSNTTPWGCFSEEGIKAFAELRHEGKIHFVPCHILVYAADGLMLSLPIVTKPPKGGYKELHWLPSIVALGPHPTGRIPEC